MNPVFNKLRYSGQKKIVVFNAPLEFKSHISEMESNCEVVKNFSHLDNYDFYLLFVQTTNQIEEISKKIGNVEKKDPVVWFAYPKKNSKKYITEINRNFGWESLAVLDIEPVSQIAIDANWSALRFRNISYINSLKRTKRTINKEQVIK